MRALGLVVVMVSGLTLAGCAAPKTATVTLKPSPTSTAVFTSNAEALAAARKAYVAYLHLSDEVSADGGEHPERMRTVAGGNAYKGETVGAEYARSKHLHTTGQTILSAFVLQQANLLTGAVAVYACTDVSKVRILNEKGADVTPKTRDDKSTTVASFALKSSTLVIEDEKTWSGKSVC